MFGEIYLGQILYVNNLSFNISTLIYSIVSVLCDMKVLNLNTLITKDDTKCTHGLKIILISIKSNDLCSIYDRNIQTIIIYLSQTKSESYGNNFISSEMFMNNLSSYTHH